MIKFQWLYQENTICSRVWVFGFRSVYQGEHPVSRTAEPSPRCSRYSKIDGKGMIYVTTRRIVFVARKPIHSTPSPVSAFVRVLTIGRKCWLNGAAGNSIRIAQRRKIQSAHIRCKLFVRKSTTGALHFLYPKQLSPSARSQDWDYPAQQSLNFISTKAGLPVSYEYSL